MSEDNTEGSNTEVNEGMEKALSSGWKPKEEFEGDVSEWVDYAEFNRRGELFSAIKESKKEVKELRKALNELADHHKKTLEAEKKLALDSLKQAKAEALREGEHEKVVEIDEKIAEVRETKTPETKVSTPVFDSWVKDNPWYNEDKVLRAFANGLVQELKSDNPNISIEEVFETITTEVKQQFPQKFQKKTTNVLSGKGTSKPLNGSKFSTSDLTPEEKQMHDRFVRMGVLTSEKYLEQIKAQRQTGAR